MGAYKFKLSLLQAVSDWQRSSTPTRAQILKEEAAALPPKFRSGVKRCYRQVGLTNGYVWNLIAEDCLRERISSWTVSYPVAMELKGGVPPKDGGYQGVIMVIERPAPHRVILNLDRLYSDCEFVAAMDANKASIVGYYDGAGRYKGNQREVVIELDEISKGDIRALGGYSSDADELTLLANMSVYSHFGRLATPAELAMIRDRAGPAWLSLAATRRVLTRTEGHAEILREVKALQDKADTTPVA
ncbi:hypothetical protein [Burkholderia ambifaria]